MREIWGLTAGVALAAALVMPQAANAAFTCTYDESVDTMAVNSSAGAGSEEIAVVGAEAPGGEITVITPGGSLVPCTGPGGPPTGNNVETLNLTGGGGETIFLLGDPDHFAPGPSGDLDLIAALGGGDDGVGVGDSTGNGDFWVLGANGVNWNGDGDVDLSLLSVEAIQLFGGEGNDALTGRGQDGTGAPFTGEFFGSGNDGNDVLEGGDGPDGLLGDENDDTLRGFAGNDTLAGGPGANQIIGGPGEDLADYLSPPDGVTTGATVDLGTVGPQDTGFGTDTLSEIEGLSGSNHADTLIGDDSANRLQGHDDNDTLEGRGGPDQLEGGAGVNTASYAQAPAGVTVDLDAGTSSGPAGADSFNSIANVTGSAFADTLTGDPQNNSITGLGGTDTISALAGADAVNVRDGGPDTASCGTEVDSATADRASVDSVDADCENVSFLPEPDPGGGNGPPPPPPPADTELSFDLTGRAKQRIVEQKGVVAKASCPLEDCTATATGTAKLPKPKRSPLAKLTLKPVTEPVAAGVAEKLKLRLKRKQLRAVAKALRAGKKPKVRVTAQVTDAVGNAVTDTLTVRAKR